ncbi:hypothetical protein CKF54_06265 [Psittacicella hinzii]|uniref:Uncharacterized protein n=1 Tax=Psittacicella hinzii TaxID=2028575 RepID=A0A3A1Y2Y0_9GAMM|nr:hypothetical protein [Psittacicella hinzii]RIY31639.1 hypothetical protein CKF54_06265 [Psittacicella hinzii]
MRKATENLFQKMSQVDKEQTKRILAWYHGTGELIEGLSNVDIVKNIAKSNKTTMQDIVAANSCLSAKFKRTVTSSQLMMFCDIYAIDFNQLLSPKLDFASIKMVQSQDLRTKQSYLTKFICLDRSAIHQFVLEAYRYFNVMGSKFSVELGFVPSYTDNVRTNSTIAQNVLDALSLRFDLRGANYLPFIEYCLEKKLLEKRSLLRDENFLNFLDKVCPPEEVKKFTKGFNRDIHNKKNTPSINRKRPLKIITSFPIEEYNAKLYNNRLPPQVTSMGEIYCGELIDVEINNDSLFNQTTPGDIIRFTKIDKFIGDGLYLIIDPDHSIETLSYIQTQEHKIDNEMVKFAITITQPFEPNVYHFKDFLETIQIVGVACFQFVKKKDKQ